MALIKSKPPHLGVCERGAARTLNQWLKRTIPEKRFSHPVSCSFYPIFWTTSEASTLDELLRCCQQFDVQWIRFTLVSVSYLTDLYCTTSSMQ